MFDSSVNSVVALQNEWREIRVVSCHARWNSDQGFYRTTMKGGKVVECARARRMQAMKLV